jgi:MFS family permease
VGFVFMTVDRLYGRSAKLALALFLLGGSTAAIAFLPGYATLGTGAIALLALFRLGQGLRWAEAGMVWPRCWRSMRRVIVGLVCDGAATGRAAGADRGLGDVRLFVASLPTEDFLSWGWRFPFFVAFAINVVALFARLRLVESPEFVRLFESRDLQPEKAIVTIREEGAPS